VVPNRLGDFIKSIRGDMSLRDFAKLCGISHTHIDSIEKGVDPRTNKTVRPTVETLNKISLGTGISIKKLVDLSMDVVSDEITLIQAKEEVKCNDLIEFLKQPEVLFNGKLLTEEDKAKVKASLEIVLWDANQKRSRKKS
jgi:transcriptional regulator with XRE-family HTH domain